MGRKYIRLLILVAVLFTLAGLVLGQFIKLPTFKGEETTPPSGPWDEFGYKVRTFYSTIAPGSYDANNTRADGFQWYRGSWFGQATPANGLTFTGEGAVINPGSGNFSIYSASPIGPPYLDWTGQAFGGGAVFEADLKFDPAQVAAVAAANGNVLPGWPAWWTLALEHMIGSTMSAQYTGTPTKNDVLWPGQGTNPNVVHFIEPDIMEYIYKNQEKR